MLESHIKNQEKQERKGIKRERKENLIKRITKKGNLLKRF